jgi:hypothetical protein
MSPYLPHLSEDFNYPYLHQIKWFWIGYKMAYQMHAQLQELQA